MTLAFDTRFKPGYGEAEPLGHDVLRLTANNPGPFTFHGTNSYVIGRNAVAVIDPGPDDPEHLRALIKAIGGRPVSHIFVSHTHRDHSPLARRLQAETGGVIAAEGPHRAARDLHVGETNLLDASCDLDFKPDLALAENALTECDGFSIRTVLTPGHAANHAAFALEGSGMLFSADHVMAWATSIVAPPDGAMADYMASLDRLLARNDRILLPGHGGPVTKPKTFMRGLKAHRKMRERAISERLMAGDRTIAAIVAAIYRDTDPRLHGAAALSVLAHLEDLVSRGGAITEGEPRLHGIYFPA